MAYIENRTLTLDIPADDLLILFASTCEGMKANITASDPVMGKIKANMGNRLGWRVGIEAEIVPLSSEKTQVDLQFYQLNMYGFKAPLSLDSTKRKTGDEADKFISQFMERVRRAQIKYGY